MIARLYGDAHIPLLFFIERGDVAAGRDKSAGSFSDRLQRTLDAVKYISQDAGGKGDRDRRSGRDHFFARHQARGGFIHLDRRKGTGYADDFAHQFLFADQHSFQHGKGSGVFHFYDRAID